MHRLALILAALAALAVASGCGSDDGGEEAEVRAALETYLAAIREGDAKAVCDGLSEAQVKELDRAGSCRKIFSEGLALIEEQGVEMPEYEIADISADGDSAQATVTAAATDLQLPLERENGEWKLSGTMTFDQLNPDDPLPRDDEN